MRVLDYGCSHLRHWSRPKIKEERTLKGGVMLIGMRKYLKHIFQLQKLYAIFCCFFLV